MAGLGPLAAWLAHRPASAHGEKHESGAAAPPVVKKQKPWGIATGTKEAKRTIEIRMGDNMRFTPSRIDVREGETLRLSAVNRGKVLREIVIGTPEELQAHAEMVKKYPHMEHDEPHMARAPAGQRSDITWTFNRAGDFDTAMRGTTRVTPLA